MIYKVGTNETLVYMCHICTHCGFPIVAPVKIYARAKKDVNIWQDAEQIVQENLRNTVANEIGRITHCRQTKKPLNSAGISQVWGEEYIYSHIEHFDTSCPYCNNIEPWQTEKNAALCTYKMDDLKDENFPIVYRQFNEALDWANKNVAALISDIESQRSNPQTIASAKARVREITSSIESIKAELRSIPEIEEIKAADEKIQELQKAIEVAETKLNDTHKLNMQLNACKKIKTRLEELLNSLQAQPKQELKNLSLSLLPNQACAYGCSDKIVYTKNDDTYTYRYMPNPIPVGELAKVEKTISGYENRAYYKQKIECEINSMTASQSKKDKSINVVLIVIFVCVAVLALFGLLKNK